ncbi:hypothetical protein FP507_03380 [Chlorobium phaeovibrioides]|uniref:Uncharacterized protein n=1 Tax=Chlorobium phaeovibrioides TaxID=1094 RepID=A0A5M8ICS5_CHLPH|nr:hypothetical protein FP507_03380 [Chlorobium phaeovibrioides]
MGSASFFCSPPTHIGPHLPSPAVCRVMRTLGSHIHEARVRRKQILPGLHCDPPPLALHSGF